MLIIRQEQIAIMVQSGLKSFGSRVVSDLKQSAPVSVQGLDDKEINARLDTAVAKCLDYRLEAERDIRAFIRLCFVVGPNFDLYPPFLDQLQALDIPAAERLSCLFKNASDLAWNNAAVFDIVSRSRDGMPGETARGETSVSVSLEPLGLDHAESYFSQSLHPDVWRLGNLIPFRDEEEARKYIISTNAAVGKSAFAIIADGFGFVGVLGIRYDGAVGRIHYWIGRPFWGRGFATRAVRLGLAEFQHRPEATYAAATIDGGNLPSLAVAGKCGFVLLEKNETLNVCHLKCRVKMTAERSEER